jgi:hypothetical protein
MRAPNDEVVPDLSNVYKSPFYLATRKEGAAILDEKLHRNGVLPKDVTFFAPYQVGGFKAAKASHATDSGKWKGVHYMQKKGLCFYCE